MSADPSAGEPMRQAWHHFFDRLRDEGELMIETVATTEQELAEGLRHLAHKAVIALQWRLEFTDPDFPVLYRTGDDRLAVSHQCMDMTYLRTQVHGDSSYRLHGEPGSAYFLVSTYEGDYSETPPESFIAERRPDELVMNADGSVDIILSATQHPGNWMPLRPGVACLVMLRQFFLDWEDKNVPGFFSIDRIDGPDRPEPLTAQRLTSQLQDATGWLKRRSRQHYGKANPAAPDTVNTVARPAALAAGSLNGAYGMGNFDLAPEQCLLITLPPPDARYWGFYVYNLWGEPPDIQNRQSSLNGDQVHVDADGLIRIVISNRDPGHPNWLDTDGNRRGSIWYRSFVLHGSATPPVCKVVPIDRLWDEVPADTPRTTPEARRSQLSMRRRHIARRFQR